MTVWVVLVDDIMTESQHLVDIYATKEKALAYLKKIAPQDSRFIEGADGIHADEPNGHGRWSSYGAVTWWEVRE